MRKWSKDMMEHFPKEDIQIANKHMKGCSASLAIREIQIKTTTRYHNIPIRMAKILNDNLKCWWEQCRETGSVIHCLWECRTVQPLWKTVYLQNNNNNKTVYLKKNPNYAIFTWSSVYTPGHLSQRNEN